MRAVLKAGVWIQPPILHTRQNRHVICRYV